MTKLTENQLNLMKTTFADKGYPVFIGEYFIIDKTSYDSETNITVHILPENCASRVVKRMYSMYWTMDTMVSMIRLI
ncbi:MAG: hypothetical protein ACLTMH_14745 [Faecalimonas umbilicata]|uniref:hypothetical protein n=1 Tax=Faecalimonas umbilicata TaxID=1912855 RepID=UPI0039950CCA